MMSALAMSAWQRASFCASAAYSDAEWMAKLRLGTCRTNALRALMAALLRCVSMVRMTTLTELLADVECDMLGVSVGEVGG
jgi:hypothetical protein